MTLVREDGRESRWLADASRKLRPEGDYRASEGSEESAVVRVDLAGNVLQRLEPPPIAAYHAGRFRRMGVAVDLQGRFRRVVGAGVLSRPTALAVDGERLLVLEFSRPASQSWTAAIGSSRTWARTERPCPRPASGSSAGLTGGRASRRTWAGAGLGVPHGRTMDGEGSLFVTEVVTGSRLTKLAKVTSPA